MAPQDFVAIRCGCDRKEGRELACRKAHIRRARGGVCQAHDAPKKICSSGLQQGTKFSHCLRMSFVCTLQDQLDQSQFFVNTEEYTQLRT